MMRRRFSSNVYKGVDIPDACDNHVDHWATVRSKLPTLLAMGQWRIQRETTPVERAETKVGKIAVKARYHQEPRRIDDDLELTPQILGTGINGAVKLAVSKTNEHHKYAVKSLMLQGRRQEQRERLIREMEIFLSLDHPRIARLMEVYESSDRLHLVMEYMEGGELFERIANRKEVFPEQDAAEAVWQMLLALNYMHTKGMVHRDVKLENWLYAKKDGNLLKLIDFGFSKVWDPNSHKTMGFTCGTLAYMAPEVIKQSYTSQCDLWSLGVIAFSLLMGYMPFEGSAQYKAMCIEHGAYKVKPEKWNRLSAPAQDFLMSLLQVDQKKRLTAQAAIQHLWIATRNRRNQEEREIDSSVVDALRGFRSASKFRRCCMAMMAWSLSYDECVQVSAYFSALDTGKDGHITHAELQEALHDKFHVNNEEVQQILDVMDTNKDAEIHYSDFLAAMMSTKIELHDEILMVTFKKFDRDRTGYITEKNLREVLGDRFEGVKVNKLLTELDLSQHNRISYPEFEAYLRNGHVKASSQKRRRYPQWLSCFPCGSW